MNPVNLQGVSSKWFDPSYPLGNQHRWSFHAHFFQEETTQRTIQTSPCPSQTYQWSINFISIVIIPGHGIWSFRCQGTITSGSEAQGCPLWWLSVTWEEWEAVWWIWDTALDVPVYKIVAKLWMQPGISKSNNIKWKSNPHQSFFHILPTWTRSIDVCFLLCWATWTAVMGHGPSIQNWHWVCENVANHTVILDN